YDFRIHAAAIGFCCGLDLIAHAVRQADEILIVRLPPHYSAPIHMIATARKAAIEASEAIAWRRSVIIPALRFGESGSHDVHSVLAVINAPMLHDQLQRLVHTGSGGDQV